MEKPIVEIDCYLCRVYKTPEGFRFVFLNALEKGGDTEIKIEKGWTMKLAHEKVGKG